LLGFFLAGAAILYSAIGRPRFTTPSPSFVPVAIAFCVFGALSLLYSEDTIGDGVRAIKRYYQYAGLFFVLAVVPFTAARVRHWLMFLVALATIQFPFALYQRVMLAPGLEGKPGVVPLDIVVGTMEGSLQGGGASAVMALFLVAVLSYVLAAYREGLLSTSRFLLLALIVVAPLPLGEVTLIVVILPIALLVVYADALAARPLRSLLGLLIAIPAAGMIGWAYLLINAEPGRTVEAMIDAVIAYNFGEKSYFSHGLNRTSVYTYWLQNHGLENPLALMFGHGLGSSFGSIGEPDAGHMEMAHGRIYIGLTAASSVLWDLGVLGLTTFISIFILAAREAGSLAGQSSPGFDRAFCRGLQATAWMLAVMPFYSNAAISLPSQEVLTWFTLGLIAWRHRMRTPRQGEVGAAR